MYPSTLEQSLEFAFRKNYNVLVKGTPGIGKTDIIEAACKKLDYDLIVSHPVVADPTDYKGLPFIVEGLAEFLPFGMLRKLMNAKRPTVCFFDDFGQASPSVQSAVMQLLLYGAIDGHEVNKKYVRFAAATNNRGDNANVTGILEPVKGRFVILNLEVGVKDWISWAAVAKMPHQLMAFVQWKGIEALNNFKPTKDIENSPTPRTVAVVGRMMNDGLPQKIFFEMIEGSCGKAWAHEFKAFMDVYLELPTIEEIIDDPKEARVPTKMSAKFAMAGSLFDAANEKTIKAIIKYLERLGVEFATAVLKNITVNKPKVAETPAFNKWAIENYKLFCDE